MAEWVQLLTSSNYGQFLPDTVNTYTDKRCSEEPLTISGSWYPSTICPYLTTSTLSSEAGAVFAPMFGEYNVHANQCFILKKDGSLQQVHFSANSNSTYDSGNKNSSAPWLPTVNRDMLDSALDNPWASIGVGYRMTNSHCEVTWEAGQITGTNAWYKSDLSGTPSPFSQMSNNGHFDLYLNWLKIPFGDNSGTPTDVETSSDSIISLGDAAYYTDSNGYPIADIITNPTNTHSAGDKILDQTSAANILDTTGGEVGTQVTQVGLPTTDAELPINYRFVPMIHAQHTWTGFMDNSLTFDLMTGSNFLGHYYYMANKFISGVKINLITKLQKGVG
jgi:hypothetical protein